MILYDIKKFIVNYDSHGNTVLNKYNNYMSMLILRSGTVMSTYIGARNFESQGVQLLKNILGKMLVSHMKNMKSDYVILQDYLMPMKDNLDIFDMNLTSSTRRDTFIDRGIFSTHEYILPVMMEDYGDLPMTKDWDSWRQLRPLRLIDHDSKEFTLNMITNKLKFSKLQPNYAILTIDVILLCMMYYKYMTSDEPNKDVHMFIQRHVLANIIKDSNVVWLRNQLIDIMSMEDVKEIEEIDINKLIHNRTYGYIGTQYKSALRDIFELVQEVKKGKKRPERLLNSLNMYGMNIGEYTLDMLSSLEIPPVRHNKWQIYLRDMKWAELVIKIYMLQPEYSQSKNMIRTLRHTTAKLKALRFWSNIKGTAMVKTLIESHFQRMLRLVRY